MKSFVEGVIRKAGKGRKVEVGVLNEVETEELEFVQDPNECAFGGFCSEGDITY